MYISKTTLLLVSLLIVAVFMLFTCDHSPAPLQGSSEQVDTLVWVNDAGDIVASLKGTPEAFAVADRKEADSIARVYRVKEKGLVEYIVALEHTNADLLAENNSKEADYFPVDSKKDCPPQVKNLRQSFSSPYYVARVQLGDSPYLHLQSFDTVTLVWKKVKEGWLFNRKHLIQLDVSTANPDTKVSGIKAYRIYEKPKRWAIGVGLGYGVSLADKIPNPVPMISISVQKTLIRF